MTGREAIHVVRTAPADQVAEWLAHDSTSATLRFVAWMRVRDLEGWRGLLREMGLVELEPSSATDRAIALWRRDYWTDHELARETGLKATTLKALRRTRLRTETWSTRAVGRHQRAYHLA